MLQRALKKLSSFSILVICQKRRRSKFSFKVAKAYRDGQENKWLSSCCCTEVGASSHTSPHPPPHLPGATAKEGHMGPVCVDGMTRKIRWLKAVSPGTVLGSAPRSVQPQCQPRTPLRDSSLREAMSMVLGSEDGFRKLPRTRHMAAAAIRHHQI